MGWFAATKPKQILTASGLEPRFMSAVLINEKMAAVGLNDKTGGG